MKIANLDELPNDYNLAFHLRNTAFGVIIWDEQMKITYCSPEAAALFQADSIEPLHQKLGTALISLYEAHTINDLIASLAAGKTNHNEALFQFQNKTGDTVYVQWYNSLLKNDQGGIVNVLSLCKDVTKRVAAEISLQQREHRHSLAFNGAIDPMWLIRAEGNNGFYFETINHAFTKVTGWTAQQVEGQPIEKIMPAASHELVRRKYNEALQTGKIIDYVEEALHPSGIKYGEIRVIPIMGTSGEPKRILGIANDITEKVYLQKTLDAEHENRRRHITSAAIKGQEVERTKVSRELHDNVNQVLTTVKLYIELCIDQKIAPLEILPKCLSLVNNSINEIRHLSKQLSAPSLGNMNFKETLTDLIESVQTTTQIQVHTDFKALTCLEMDSELHLTLYRVIQEQLTNIIKYAKATNVHVLLQEEEDLLRLIVEDNGVGFDVLQKRQGIGITNMQSRIEILNGQFGIRSKIGKGTRIEVQIPVIIEDEVCYAQQSINDVSTL